MCLWLLLLNHVHNKFLLNCVALCYSAMLSFLTFIDALNFSLSSLSLRALAAVIVTGGVEDAFPALLGADYAGLCNTHNRTSVEKCTDLYDETQGTIKHKRFRQRVFVGCRKTENNKRRRK